MSPVPGTLVLRWLLRVLCEDAFLRIYVEDVEQAAPSRLRSRAEIEHIFWSLPEDPEHGEKGREKAWRVLEDQILPASGAPGHHIFMHLRNLLARHLSEAARTRTVRYGLTARYGLDFLFPDEGSTATAPRPLLSRDGPPFIETHAHFRGSVPLVFVWSRLMDDARLRALHRKAHVAVGTWTRTRAELLALASEQAVGCAEDCKKIIDGAAPPSDTGSLRSAVAFLAIRANFARYLIYQRGEVGLGRFVKAYDRFSNAARTASAVARTHADAEQVVAVLREFQCRGVQGVELRPTFEANRIELQAKLRPLVMGYLSHIHKSVKCGREPLTFGIIPSIFKQEGLGRPGAGGASAASDWVREQSDAWCRQVDALMQLLDTVPALRLFVVGIDAAGREQGCPVRGLAPAYARVAAEHHHRRVIDATPGRRMGPWRQALKTLVCPPDSSSEDPLEAAARAWTTINDEWSGRISPIRLGRTIHVGEDFLDPVTGLREISEAIEHLGLTRGDRLGHALALGLNPPRLKDLLERRARAASHRFVKEVASGRHCIAKPVGVELLDVAWSARLLGDHGRDVSLASSRVFAASTSLSGICRDLECTGSATSLRVPGLHFFDLDHVPPDLFTWVTVDDPYYRRYEALRQRVRSQVRALGLFIESCPTSNLLVAGMHEPPLNTFVEEDLAVTLASDDPAVFNAWPDAELQRFGGPTEEQRDRLIARSRLAAFI